MEEPRMANPCEPPEYREIVHDLYRELYQRLPSCSVRAQPPRERVGALRARDLLVGVDDQDHLVRIARRVGRRAALRARRVRAEVRAGRLSGMIDLMRRSTSCVASRGALPADAPAASTASAAAAPRAATPLAVTPPGSTLGAFTFAALGLCGGTSWLRGW